MCFLGLKPFQRQEKDDDDDDVDEDADIDEKKLAIILEHFCPNSPLFIIIFF